MSIYDKKLVELLQKFDNENDIGLYGDSNFGNRVKFFISANMDEKNIAITDTDQIEFEQKFNIIICRSENHFINLLNREDNKSDSIILSPSIINYIYENNSYIYTVYENEMKNISKLFINSLNLLQLFQTHILFLIIKKHYKNHYDFKEETKKSNAVHCFWPWLNLYVRGNILEWCCGYTYDSDQKDAWDDKKEILNVKKAINGSAFKKARSLIINSENNGNCRNCHNFFFSQNVHYMFDFITLNSTQQKNFEFTLYNYWVKSLELDSSPLRYELITTFKCNLSCIMCNQEQYNKLPYSIKEEDILNNLDEMKKAIEISLFGGEFFAMSNSKKILDIFIDNDFTNTNFVFITNAIYLDKYFTQLEKINKATFNISIDAVGKRYELIRQKGNWDKLESNVKQFLDLKQKSNKKWNILIHVIIMKSSIPGLVDLVKWCIKYDLPIGIIKYEYNSFNHENEDVFAHPELLNEIEGWDEQIIKSLELLEENNFDSSYSSLLQLYAELKNKKEVKWKSSI